VAATFLPGRLRKRKTSSLEQDGDRVIYAGKDSGTPLERVEEFLELLDD
jgi:transcription-repair coupling factor (superfamily II helicase)